MSAKVWNQGVITDAADAQVPFFDRGFLYGDSIYEVLRTFSGKAIFLEQHLQRLAASAAGIGLTPPAADLIRKAITETLAAAGEDNAYIRLIVTRGAGALSLDPAMADAPRLLVLVKRVEGPTPEMYRSGVEVAIVDRGRTSPDAPGRSVDPAVKSGNYLPSVLAVAEAKRRGAYEPILCDQVGRLTEGGSSNFFIVRGGRVATPPIRSGLLAGITRTNILALCRKNNIATDEQPLWPVDLRGCDEAFLTSSIRGVLAVVGVDGKPIGNGAIGPLTTRISTLYQALIDSLQR